MKSAELIQYLKRSLNAKSDQALRRELGLSPMTIDSWRRRRVLSTRIVGQLIKRLAQERLNGQEIVAQMQHHLRAKTLTDLSNKVGMTNQAIQNWKGRTNVTSRQIAGLVRNASKAGASTLQANAIRPLVEFFRIDRCESKNRAKFEVFTPRQDGYVSDHPYRAGLKEELAKHCGVYIFFDSRGQAIYAGKARRQFLWTEINLAFNRDRGGIQNIKRVRHPENRVQYRTSDEKARQITEAAVPLHELASYFSAYHVADEMIDDLESLLVRSFANDLLNKRMERFSRQRRRA